MASAIETRAWKAFDAFMCRPILGYKPLEWLFSVGVVGGLTVAWITWVFYL